MTATSNNQLNGGFPFEHLLRLAVVLPFCLSSQLCLCERAEATNSVRVASASVGAGGAVVIGVYLTNDVPLKSLVIPLVVRSSDTSHAYMNAWTPAYNPYARLAGYLHEYIAPIINQYPIEDGHCKNGGAGGFLTAEPAVDFVSPDAVSFIRLRIYSYEDLPAGIDGPVPSITISLTANATTGSFDIDTTCISGASHLNFVSGQNVGIIPDFFKGTVTVGNPDLGIWPRCHCPEPADTIDVITSPFGPRYICESGVCRYDYHPGIDLRSNPDDVVFAIDGGTVVETKQQNNSKGLSIGWYAKIESYGFDQCRNSASFTAIYHHMWEPTLLPGEIVSKGGYVGFTGSFPGVDPHLHLETRPNFDDNKRAHPVRYLTKPELGCPDLDPFKMFVGDSGRYDYLICTTRSPRTDRYDLSKLDIWIYDTLQKDGKLAAVNFEDYKQMLPDALGRRESTLVVFKDDPVYETKVTFRPCPLIPDPDSLYHKIEVKIDPKCPIRDSRYIGVQVEDVAISDGPPLARKVATEQAGPQCGLTCGPNSIFGNVTGHTPGLTMLYFSGRRIDSTVELSWLAAEELSAAGVKILRSRNKSPEQVINSGLLPLRNGSTLQDTVVCVDREAGVNDNLVYNIEIEFENGSSIRADQTVSIPAARETGALPGTFALGQNYPNPFNGSTEIPFDLSGVPAGPIRLRIFDVLGRFVRTVFEAEDVVPGRQHCEWDGRDSHGNPAASGLYFYRLETKGKQVSKKMLLLK